MKIPVTIVLACICLQSTEAQFGFGGFRNLFQPLQNLLQPVMRGVQNIFVGGPKFRDDGTQSPLATGKEKLFPDDCGRDEDKGTGKLCFPDGLLCQERKLLMSRMQTKLIIWTNHKLILLIFKILNNFLFVCLLFIHCSYIHLVSLLI
jgi:hypothetical protein